MNRPRVPLGLEATRATLNRAACLQVGRALAEARRERDLSIRVVGSRLLLSPVQVAALEDVNPDAFYSAEFFVCALKKYAALVGVASDQIDRALVGPARTDTVAPSPFRRRRQPEAPLMPVRPRKTAIAIAAVLVAALAAWSLVSAFRSTSARTVAVDIPRTLDEVTAVTPLTEPIAAPAVSADAAAPQVIAALDTSSAEPATHAVTTRAVDGSGDTVFGRVRVSTPTWIFVRYANGAPAERGLPAGGEFVLRERPTYLAVGTADGTEIEIGGRAVNAASFVADGQLRIGASTLAKLARP